MTPSSQIVQSSQSGAPIIEVLYFDGCPNYEHAVALVKKALAAERISAPIHLRRIASNEEARREGFYGSPTIRVNGKDIAPLPVGGTPSLACRVYRGPDGRLAPVPGYETLIAALRGDFAGVMTDTSK
jgi:hypothetical protein